MPGRGGRATGSEWFVRLTAADERTALRRELLLCAAAESPSDAASALLEVEPAGSGRSDGCGLGLVFSLMPEITSDDERLSRGAGKTGLWKSALGFSKGQWRGRAAAPTLIPTSEASQSSSLQLICCFPAL